MLSRKKLGMATPCMSSTTSAPSAPSGSSRHTWAKARAVAVAVAVAVARVRARARARARASCSWHTSPSTSAGSVPLMGTQPR
eukprot:scaffold13645_cov58-Phaeocystis_antarctica.AAC.5